MAFRTPHSAFHTRRLRLEPLEDRRVLASVVVTNNLDTVNGDTSNLAALESMPGEDGISIREAIEAANNTPGADEITFDFGHDGSEVILLTEGELLITDSLTIMGEGPELLTIDAGNGLDGDFGTGDGWRVINIDSNKSQSPQELIDAYLTGLTITGGDTLDGQDEAGVASHSKDAGHGGGIHSIANLTISDCHITRNATGDGGDAGGLAQPPGYSGNGGGVYHTVGQLTIADSIIDFNLTGNGGATANDDSVEGTGGHGGGIYAYQGRLTIIHSTIASNTTGNGGSSIDVATPYLIRGGNGGSGGGILADSAEVVIRDSLIANNATGNGGAGNFAGNGGSGGGLSVFGTLGMTMSTVRDNSTGTGSLGSHGGSGAGIEISGFIPGFPSSLTGPCDSIIQSSTIHGNRTGDGETAGGNAARGGGISLSALSCNAIFQFVNTTISENFAQGPGGGVSLIAGELQIEGSTIIGNHSLTTSAAGLAYEEVSTLRVQLHNTIAAANHGEDVSVASGTANFIISNGYNLIGTGSGISAFTSLGDLVGVDPHLGPLADHGGPTMTHALLPGSPAIDAGDPLIAYDPLQYDQRGEGFARVADSGGGLRIDIGAYESQGAPDYPVGDYNHDGVADALDYAVWKSEFGSSENLQADGNGDGRVDLADFVVWRNHLGNTTVSLTPIEPPIETPPAATDAAFASLVSPEVDSEPTGAAKTHEAGTAEGSADDGLLLLGRGEDGDRTARYRSLPRGQANPSTASVVAAAGLEFDWGL